MYRLYEDNSTSGCFYIFKYVGYTDMLELFNSISLILVTVPITCEICLFSLHFPTIFFYSVHQNPLKKILKKNNLSLTIHILPRQFSISN